MARSISVLAWGLAALLGAGVSAHAAEPINRGIKDWNLACDNTRACQAMVGPDSYGFLERAKDTSIPTLRVSRAPGPGGRLVVSVTYGPSYPNPEEFRLDGRPIGGAFAWGRDPDWNAVTLSGPEAVRFLDLIRNGSDLAVTSDAKADPLSLSGLTASLLAIDEAQGRLDDATALVRRGRAPASAVPPADPAPVLRAVPAKHPLAHPKAFIAAIRESRGDLLKAHSCEPVMAEADRAYALDDRDALVILGCKSDNRLMLLLRAPRSAPALAREVTLPGLHGPQAGIFGPGEYYVEDGWDSATATLTECGGLIGYADCTRTTRGYSTASGFACRR